LQRAIDCGGVTSGTTSYDDIQAALELAELHRVNEQSTLDE